MSRQTLRFQKTLDLLAERLSHGLAAIQDVTAEAYDKEKLYYDLETLESGGCRIVREVSFSSGHPEVLSYWGDEFFDCSIRAAVPDDGAPESIRVHFAFDIAHADTIIIRGGRWFFADQEGG